MSEYRNFHAGEAAVQARAGVDTGAYDDAVDQPFRPELNDSEVRFVGARSFSVAASIDEAGRPWASPLVGRPGELFTVDDRTTIRIRHRSVAGDPLVSNVESTGSMGVLFFNPAIRRRAKSLGHGTVENGGSITYRMHRMFGLCPKYIAKRAHDPDGGRVVSDIEPAMAAELTEADRVQFEQADTIFLASQSERFGADPTHRGGPPGFVTVEDSSTLWMPDYVGNGMFQTLGNLQLDDRIAVLAIDFDSGRLVQVTGRGSLEDVPSGSPLAARLPARAATDRALRVTVEEVRSTVADIGSWTAPEAYALS